MKTLILLLITSTTLFAGNLPHLDLEKYSDKLQRATMERVNEYYSLNNKDRALYYLRSILKKTTLFL